MWRFWIDTGGTFTDCLALDPEGRFHRAKVLSSSQIRVTVTEVTPDGIVLREVPAGPTGLLTGLVLSDLSSPDGSQWPITGWADGLASVENPPANRDLTQGQWAIQSPEEAPLLGIRLILGLPLAAPLPPLSLRLATTKATNALLERRGAPVTLFVTTGFGDLLEIGTQQRPDLFAKRIIKPKLLPKRVVEVPSRQAADFETALRELPGPGSEEAAAAVSLIGAYANPEWEDRLAEALRGRGWKSVITGSSLSGRLGYLQRTRTAAAEAFLDRLMSRYLDRVESAIAPGRLLVMSSRGALLSRALLRSRDTLLSGPAGGLTGAAEIARRAGCPRTLTFDMGGTSTDVARYDNRPGYQESLRVGDAELQVIALRIETIAAGGGSLCAFSQGALKVGPESAGSNPGPACYGAGGPLTITDVNVLLGRLYPGEFGLPISLDAARVAAGELLAEVNAYQPGATLEAMLEGLLEIANEKMAEALRRISVREGYDPSEYSLTAFGGAGGWHACALAERLGVRKVVFPADAGLLSAFGLSCARREHLAERQILRPLEDCAEEVPAWIGELESAARAVLEEEGIGEVDRVWARASLRLLGQEATLEIEPQPGLDLAEAFATAFRGLFGFYPRGKRIELVLLQVLVAEQAFDPPLEDFPALLHVVPAPRWQVRAWLGGSWRDLPVYARADLSPGTRLAGPAIVQDRFATIFLEPGWRAVTGSAGTLLVGQAEVSERSLTSQLAAVELELFTHRFTGLVEQMGALLRRTALSVNIRERLDFSCGLLDAQGELVANAPHIPVHLGALGLCARSVVALLELHPGDMAVTNHPGHGGSHLPDITVIAPAHTPDGRLIGYIANRAHHAELGGIRPGSMPPGARHLAEEGVVIPPTFVMRAGAVDLGAVTALLQLGPWPTRALEDNLADLQAQIAANRLGTKALLDLVAAEGFERVTGYFGKLADQAARAAESVFAALPDHEVRAEQQMENGAFLRVALRRQGRGMIADFAGTSPVTPDNFNATPAIVRSALIYALRLASGVPIPLNEGFLRAVDLRLPDCLLNPAFPPDPAACPAVVAGNVETSQRLVDTLLLALDAAAASQGTMNNTVFGNARFGYYETLCGGSGAVADGPGASAVHCHMTNTAITDPEVLEARYPVRLRRFAIRPDSGGAGRHPGGNGAIREYEFLEPVEVSLLTERRRTGPYGLHGGSPGLPGWQKVIRADGSEEILPPTVALSLEAGDRLVIATPGGGGWGSQGPLGSTPDF